MMKIGVEEGLTNVADYLKNQGYSVEVLGRNIESNISKCKTFDAIVTSDYNTNMMGICDTSTKIPVINASGLTGEEVKSMLQQKVTK